MDCYDRILFLHCLHRSFSDLMAEDAELCCRVYHEVIVNWGKFGLTVYRDHYRGPLLAFMPARDFDYGSKVLIWVERACAYYNCALHRRETDDLRAFTIYRTQF